MLTKLCLLGVVVATLIAVSSKVEGKRIAQIKCDKYIRDTVQVTKVIALTLNPTPIEFTSFKCSKTVDLIVGGEDAKEGEFPHQALLGWETQDPNEFRFDCGGTLISEWFVLTAAHCMNNQAALHPMPAIVRLGELNLNHKSSNEFDIEIDNIIRHPQHKFGRAYHDIALIKLKQRVYFSSLVQPACLWDDLNVNVSSIIATGFGATEFASDLKSDKLRKVQLEVMDSSECEHFFVGLRNFARGFTDQQLCIGSTRSRGDTCQGDSGGPIQVLLNPKGCTYYVIGITSVGAGCGNVQTPAVYTKVAGYIDWIESIVWG